MGHYIQTGEPTGKAEYITGVYDAIRIERPKDFSDVPDSLALVCIVSNGPFEAAAYIYDQEEFDRLTRGDDQRPRCWILMDRNTAERLAR